MLYNGRDLVFSYRKKIQWHRGPNLAHGPEFSTNASPYLQTTEYRHYKIYKVAFRKINAWLIWFCLKAKQIFCCVYCFCLLFWPCMCVCAEDARSLSTVSEKPDVSSPSPHSERRSWSASPSHSLHAAKMPRKQPGDHVRRTSSASGKHDAV